MPGVRVRRVARLPERLPELVQRLGPEGRRAFALTRRRRRPVRARSRPISRPTTRRPGWTGTSPCPGGACTGCTGSSAPATALRRRRRARPAAGRGRRRRGHLLVPCLRQPGRPRQLSGRRRPLHRLVAGQPGRASWLAARRGAAAGDAHRRDAGVGRRRGRGLPRWPAGRRRRRCTRAPTASRSRPQTAARLRLVVDAGDRDRAGADHGGRVRRGPHDPPTRSRAEQLRRWWRPWTASRYGCDR